MKRIFTVFCVLSCFLILNTSIWAYHAPPLDTGHGIAKPKPQPPEPPEPPDDDPCKNKDKPASGSKGSPVYVATGGFIKTFMDVSIPTPGLSLDVVRTYNSQDHYNGPFGYGWVSEHTMQLIEYTDGVNWYVTIRLKDGRRAEFLRTTATEYTPLKVLPGDRLVHEARDPLTPSSGTPGSDFVYKLNPRCAGCARSSNPEIWFNEKGFLELIRDNRGNWLRFYYNSDGLLSKVMHSSGKSLLYFYGTNRKVSSIQLPDGNYLRYEYDSDDNLISFTDPEGNTTRYVYDDSHRLISIVDPEGRPLFQAEYDEFNRVTKYQERELIYTYSYDPANKKTTKTDSNNKTTTYYYNDDEVITKIVFPDGSVKEFKYDENGNPVELTDENGNRWKYEYDENGNLLKKTDPLGNVWKYTYNERNQITSITDPLGYSITYEYDTKGNLIKKTDKLGNSWVYTYNQNGQKTSVTDPLGRKTTYEYDKDGNLIKIIDPLGNETLYSYDSLGRRRSKKDPRGNITYYIYDDAGRLIAVRDPYGDEIRYTYDGAGNKIAETDPLGNTTKYVYDEYGRVVKVIDPLGNETLYEYDTYGNIVSITDPLGNKRSWLYDERGRLIKETDAEGNSTSFEYDKAGNLKKKTDPEGNVWTYEYDPLGRVLKIVDPSGYVRTLKYNAVGKITEIGDSSGYTITRSYDANGRKIRQTDRMGFVTTFNYDAVGNVISITVSGNGEIYTTSYEYDKRDKKIKEIHPNGYVKRFEYDENGNLKKEIYPNGNEVIYHYDALNRLIKIEDSLGVLKEITYDRAGRIVAQKSGGGFITRYEYDARGKRIKVIYPDGSTMEMQYDEAGRLVSLKNRSGTTLQFIRDKNGKLIELSDGIRTGKVSYNKNGLKTKIIDYKGNEIKFEYFPSGKVKRIIHPDSSERSFKYDLRGNLIEETRPSGYVIKYSYDLRDRVTKVEFPDGSYTSYSYNLLNLMTFAITSASDGSIKYTLSYAYNGGRLIKTEQPFGVVQYQYDSINGIRKLIYPDGTTIKESYDLRGRLTKIEDITDAQNPIVLLNKTINSSANSLTFTYGNGIGGGMSFDSNGITRIFYEKDSTKLFDLKIHRDISGKVVKEEDLLDTRNTKRYEYDSLGRLVRYLLGDNQTSEDITYVLDANSNWKSLTDNSGFYQNNINSLNQYTVFKGNNYSYDKNGNLLADGAHKYTFDYLNRLIEIKDSNDNSIATYEYDPLGRRIKKVVGSDTYTYVYSNSSQILAIYKNGNLLYNAIYDGTRPNQAFALKSGPGNFHYFIKDRIGNVVKVTDASGNIVEHYRYDPYGIQKIFDSHGNEISDSGIENPFRYTGGFFDSESGLYYLIARYYAPWMGRFLSRDPMGYLRGGLNLYEYANSNPVSFIDPLGLEAECEEVKSYEYDLSDKFEKLLKKIRVFSKVDLDSESGIEVKVEECHDRCCIQKTGTWKEASWYQFSITGKAKISYKQAVPGWSVSVPGTDISAGVFLELGIELSASGMVSKAFDKNCILRPYGEACLTLEEAYIQVSAELHAYVVEGGIYAKLYVKAALCLDSNGYLKGKACIGGTIWAEGKIDLWITEYESSVDIWGGMACTQASWKVF